MLILPEVVLTKKALLVPAIFSDPLFSGFLKNNLQLLNLPQMLGMYLLLPNPMNCAHHERLWSDL
jgi:hypothetical protein